RRCSRNTPSRLYGSARGWDLPSARCETSATLLAWLSLAEKSCPPRSAAPDREAPPASERCRSAGCDQYHPRWLEVVLALSGVRLACRSSPDKGRTGIERQSRWGPVERLRAAIFRLARSVPHAWPICRARPEQPRNAVDAPVQRPRHSPLPA